jgi:trk system potassium uptake protein TrkH
MPIVRVLSYVLAITGFALLPPLGVALAYGERGCVAAFAAPLAASWLAALACWLANRRGAGTFEARNAFIVVGGAWVSICVFGALPLWTSGAFASFSDAVFESVSGFTTTGASVMPDVESLPRCVNLWRCETHWLGGMGVIALAVALIPLLGIGGFRLIKAETSGPEKGKVTSRIADTAKALWFIYFSMTALQAVLLRYAGMDWFDAVCHAFSTLGTGGFSTRNASVGAFSNGAVDWICTIFMLLASVNFALYYRLFTGRGREFLRDTELHGFLGIVALSVAAVTCVEVADFGSLGPALRHSAFQVASIVSTTGFMTSDYAAWRPAAQVVLFALFLVGGCSGSTAGGIKVIRWTILAKQLKNEFARLLHPHAVVTLRINGVPGRETFVPLVAAFVFVYLLLVLFTAFAGALAGLGLVESVGASLSMVGNIGPAFGEMGPTANYAALPAALKWWYAFAMLAGRLELYTMLILLGRAFGAGRS